MQPHLKFFTKLLMFASRHARFFFTTNDRLFLAPPRLFFGRSGVDVVGVGPATGGTGAAMLALAWAMIA